MKKSYNKDSLVGRFLSPVKSMMIDMFSERRKRADLYLFIILIFALWFARRPYNIWLLESFGERMAAVSAFLRENPGLLSCLCILVILGTGSYVITHFRDYYCSRRCFMIILLIAYVLIASTGYWNYVHVVGWFTLLHLLLFCLSLALFSVCFVFQRKSKSDDKLSGRNFTIDAVDSTVGEDQDNNRQAYADFLVDRILGTELGDESFSVGISREWGTGKTTFLRAVEKSLEKYLPERVATIVWFKPWNSSSP